MLQGQKNRQLKPTVLVQIKLQDLERVLNQFVIFQNMKVCSRKEVGKKTEYVTAERKFSFSSFSWHWFVGPPGQRGSQLMIDMSNVKIVYYYPPIPSMTDSANTVVSNLIISGVWTSGWKKRCYTPTFSKIYKEIRWLLDVRKGILTLTLPILASIQSITGSFFLTASLSLD